jgi:Txe/YoeB family toxin of Txe-Axe toxin-antitoxin module
VEARSWYNLQQNGLGKKIVTDVKIAISSIKQNPYFASVKFENLRTDAYKTFRYAIPLSN